MQKVILMLKEHGVVPKAYRFHPEAEMIFEKCFGFGYLVALERFAADHAANPRPATPPADMTLTNAWGIYQRACAKLNEMADAYLLNPDAAWERIRRDLLV